MSDILIIGAGAAGLMAAGAAVRQGHRVTVLEHTEKPGQKLLITGKGRCNVTNACGEEEFLRHIRKNSRFLYSSLDAFPPAKTMELFEQLGVPLKTERGRRVFPVSDRAEDIRQALLRYCGGAHILHEEAARLVLEPAAPPEPTGPAAGCAAQADETLPARREKHAPRAKKQKGPQWICRGVQTASGKTLAADAVLVATGGVSYPTTGSTGDGYRLAQQAGHSIEPPVPSLVSLLSPDADCKKMMGLALKNVALTLLEDGKPVFCEQGEMLFTHFGISGPLTLSASAHLGDLKRHHYVAEIDLKPALDDQQLYDRVTRDFALLANHAAQGALGRGPCHQGQPDHPRAKAAAGAAAQALAGAHRRPGRSGPRGDHLGRCVRARGGPQNHAEQAGRGAVFCGRGAGCGRLHRRLQSSGCLVHRPGLCRPSARAGRPGGLTALRGRAAGLAQKGRGTARGQRIPQRSGPETGRRLRHPRAGKEFSAMKKTETVCKWLFWATAAAAVVYGAAGMAGILTSPLTGFPWWAAWTYAAQLFALPLLAEGAAWALVRRMNKTRAARAEEK